MFRGYEDIDESDETDLAQRQIRGRRDQLTINALKPPPLPQRNKNQGTQLGQATGQQNQTRVISLNSEQPGRYLAFYLTQDMKETN